VGGCWIIVFILSHNILFPFGETLNKQIHFVISTIGHIDSGIVDSLENEFEKETGIRVCHVDVGSGAALGIAWQGNVDLVLVHAKSLEEKFVKEGYIPDSRHYNV